MNNIAKFIFFDILKNEIVLLYTLLLFVISWSVLGLDSNYTKATLSLLNIVLLVVPLVSIIFSTIYVYNSSQFIELLLSQPIARGKIWLNIFIGLSSALILAYLLGCGVPICYFMVSIGIRQQLHQSYVEFAQYRFIGGSTCEHYFFYDLCV